jgi:hypothetical protein
MDHCSIRVLSLNAATLMISLTNLEATLKILLLIISIAYTSMKIYDWVMYRIKGKKTNEE